MRHVETFAPDWWPRHFCCACTAALALTVDFPRAAFGFKSDEATYYMMAYSLVEDGDLTYTQRRSRPRLARVSGGPAGVFLKKGQTLAGAPIPIRTVSTTASRSSIRSFAAPFVKLFGTNGFLVLHALLLALVVLCGYLFLHARSSPLVSALLASGFVMASVVPVYFVWMMPEFFNFSLAFLALLLLALQGGGDAAASPRGTAWLFTRPQRRRRRRAARDRDVFEADQRAAVCRRCALAALAGFGARRSSSRDQRSLGDRRGVRFCRRRPVRRSTWRSPATGTTRGAIGTRTTFEFPFQNGSRRSTTSG